MRFIVAAILMLLLSACGFQKKEIRLSIPEVANVTEGKRTAAIGEIVDKRDFFTTPGGTGARLDKGLIDSLGEHGRELAVGGNDHWVQILGNGQSVQGLAKALIRDSLAQSGYRVIPLSEKDLSTEIVTAEIREFWCYFPFNFGRALTWTQQLKAQITLALTVRQGDRTNYFEINGFGANIIQFYTEENTRQTYEIAMKDLEKDLRMKVLNSQ